MNIQSVYRRIDVIVWCLVSPISLITTQRRMNTFEQKKNTKLVIAMASRELSLHNFHMAANGWRPTVMPVPKNKFVFIEILKKCQQCIYTAGERIWEEMQWLKRNKNESQSPQKPNWMDCDWHIFPKVQKYRVYKKNQCEYWIWKKKYSSNPVRLSCFVSAYTPLLPNDGWARLWWTYESTKRISQTELDLQLLLRIFYSGTYTDLHLLSGSSNFIWRVSHSYSQKDNILCP